MSMRLKIFKDKYGRDIKAGDILFRKFYVRMRERPGHKRVGLDMMGGEHIVPDEGNLLEANAHWITRRVNWHGACMSADREQYSDFQALMGGSLFDENGNPISETTASMSMNSCFTSENYEIVEG